MLESEGIVDEEFADVILRSAAKVRDLQAAGKLSPSFVDVPIGELAVEGRRLKEELLAASARGAERNDEPAVHSARDLAALEHLWNGNEAARSAPSRSPPFGLPLGRKGDNYDRAEQPWASPSGCSATHHADPPNVWATSDLRGKRLRSAPRDDLKEPGPGRRRAWRQSRRP